MMEYDTPQPKRNEFNRIQMQDFAIQAEEATGAQKQIRAQEAWKEIGQRENAPCTLVHYLENKLQTQRTKSSTARFAFQAIESALQTQLRHAQLECRNYVEMYDEFSSRKHLLQDQKSLLAHSRKRWYQHHQDLTVMPKHFETASLQSPENLRKRALSDETLMLRRELESMKDVGVRATGDPRAEEYRRIACHVELGSW